MPKKKERTYEEGLARLRELIDQLESGSLPLKGTFDAYEEGRTLLKELEATLREGERRILELDAHGEVSDITADIEEAKEEERP